MDASKIEPPPHKTLPLAEVLDHLNGRTGREVWNYDDSSGIEEVEVAGHKTIGLRVLGWIELAKEGAPKYDEENGSWSDMLAYKVAHVERFYFKHTILVTKVAGETRFLNADEGCQQ